MRNRKDIEYDANVSQGPGTAIPIEIELLLDIRALLSAIHKDLHK